ncbi:hypothetical protein ACFPM1_04780 [Halorubrum rubrum]|uniref:Uncharacterized protein n=1 Tax=Halorubrum rubrum TaxID=1126240 RepID=A0ABD5QZG4_9EURY|nr:hypothetical protein [Halorubrum rubrum]
MYSPLGRLRRPEFTGDRRCWPCTVVNGILIGLLVGGVALVTPLGATLLAVVGCLGIWLRGYLVPYTPRFAPYLVKPLPWDPFHATPGSDSLAAAEDADGAAVMEALAEADVVRLTPESLELDNSFYEAWQAEMERLAAVGNEKLADTTVSVSPATAAVDVHRSGEQTYIVLSDGSTSIAGETWLRRPVAVVETAAAHTLAEWGVDSAVRPFAAHALGLFLDTCPECGGDVTERPASGCCGPPERGPSGELLQARMCESCHVRYHVFE